MDVQNSTFTPNFKAKFVPKVKLNKERWNNVAKIFEKKTQKYPNDTLYMTDGSGRWSSTVTEVKDNGKKTTRTSYSAHYFFATDKKELVKDNESTTEWFNSDVIGNMLANYTDSEIASKLVKIFKQCKKQETYNNKFNLIEKTTKTDKEFATKADKLQNQYFLARKEYYEKDGVLKEAADTYNMFID